MTSDSLLSEGSPITRAWLASVMEKKYNRRPIVKEATPLGKEAIGYMSLIRRVALEWDSEDENLPKTVVIKVASATAATEAMSGSTGESASDVDQAAQMAIVQRVFHNTEVEFLNMFSKVDNLEVLAPEIYGAFDISSPTPCIVMKDYGSCHLVDLVDGFNEKQLQAIVDQVATIQAFSLTNDDWKKIEPPAEWEALMSNFACQMLSVCEKLMEEMPEVFGCLQRFIDNTFKKDMDWILKKSLEYRNGERPSVLIHGDLWAPQIMWKDDVTIGVIVDWQLPRSGSPAEDILRILSTCTSVENRKSLETALFDRYYEKLAEKLELANVKMPFTREELNDEIKFAMVNGCMNTVFANAFWANSDVLKPDGVPDMKRMMESFGRCKTYIEDVLEIQGW